MSSLIEEAFNICQPYLDNDFKNQFSQVSLSDLWKLYVCHTLVNSPARKFLKAMNSEEPDFMLERFFNNKNVYIECICPQNTEGTEKNVNSEDYIISLFRNALKSKADYFEEKYQYTKSHHRVLCVSGAIVASLKQKRNNLDRLPETFSDFKSAICPYKYYVNKYGDFHSSPIYSQPTNTEFEKGEKKILVGHEEYLLSFDAIVFSDIRPFNTRTLEKFSLCFKEGTTEDFRQALTEIFK